MKITVPEGKLLEAINGCKGACAAKGCFKPMLMNVELRVQDNDLTITSSNGFMVIERTIKGYEDETFEDGFCLVDPQMIADSLRKDGFAATLTLEGKDLLCETAFRKITIKADTTSDFSFARNVWKTDDNTHQFLLDIDIALRVLKGLKQGKSDPVMFSINPVNSNAIIQITGRKGDPKRAILLPMRMVKGAAS
jgi:DNA polymerase III sliding clamp (beta) subunit (PCNA family)